jgi:hypothetical protein
VRVKWTFKQAVKFLLIYRICVEIAKYFLDMKGADHLFSVQAGQGPFIPFQPNALQTLRVGYLQVIAEKPTFRFFLHDTPRRSWIFIRPGDPLFCMPPLLQYKIWGVKH